MLFAHAPIIFPAVLGYPVVFNPGFYVFLVTLQVSLLLRVGADLMGNWQLRLWAGVLNGIALLLFIVMTMIMVLGGIIREKRAAAEA
jgi:predicted small integral membrane protein